MPDLSYRRASLARTEGPGIGPRLQRPGPLRTTRSRRSCAAPMVRPFVILLPLQGAHLIAGIPITNCHNVSIPSALSHCHTLMLTVGAVALGTHDLLHPKRDDLSRLRRILLRDAVRQHHARHPTGQGDVAEDAVVVPDLLSLQGAHDSSLVGGGGLMQRASRSRCTFRDARSSRSTCGGSPTARLDASGTNGRPTSSCRPRPSPPPSRPTAPQRPTTAPAAPPSTLRPLRLPCWTRCSPPACRLTRRRAHKRGCASLRLRCITPADRFRQSRSDTSSSGFLGLALVDGCTALSLTHEHTTSLRAW